MANPKPYDGIVVIQYRSDRSKEAEGCMYFKPMADGDETAQKRWSNSNLSDMLLHLKQDKFKGEFVDMSTCWVDDPAGFDYKARRRTSVPDFIAMIEKKAKGNVEFVTSYQGFRLKITIGGGKPGRRPARRYAD